MLAMEEIYYTPEEVAKKLRVSEYTIKLLLRDRKLEGYKVGNQWRITETAITQYLEEQKNKK